MKFETIRGEIKAKKYHPVYLLHGEESFYIDEIVDILEDSVLTEAEKAFNFTIFYGKDSNAIQIMEAARRLPMMAPYQLVIVKEAQYLRDIVVLESYLDHIVPSTILVIVHKNKKVDGRKKVFKAMEKKGAVLYSKKISERILPDWINTYVEDKGYRIDGKATQVLAQYLGTDLSKVANELSKLFINKKKDEVIDSADIEKNIGISKDYNVFEFQDALGARDLDRSYKIMNYIIDNQKNNPFPVIVGTLYGYFSKVYVLSKFKNPGKDIYSELSIPPFFQSKFKAACDNYSTEKLERTMIELGKYDLRSKGVDNRNVEHASLLKELVYKILN